MSKSLELKNWGNIKVYDLTIPIGVQTRPGPPMNPCR